MLIRFIFTIIIAILIVVACYFGWSQLGIGGFVYFDLLDSKGEVIFMKIPILNYVLISIVGILLLLIITLIFNNVIWFIRNKFSKLNNNKIKKLIKMQEDTIKYISLGNYNEARKNLNILFKEKAFVTSNSVLNLWCNLFENKKVAYSKINLNNDVISMHKYLIASLKKDDDQIEGYLLSLLVNNSNIVVIIYLLEFYAKSNRWINVLDYYNKYKKVCLYYMINNRDTYLFNKLKNILNNLVCVSIERIISPIICNDREADITKKLDEIGGNRIVKLNYIVGYLRLYYYEEKLEYFYHKVLEVEINKFIKSIGINNIVSLNSHLAVAYAAIGKDLDSAKLLEGLITNPNKNKNKNILRSIILLYLSLKIDNKRKLKVVERFYFDICQYKDEKIMMMAIEVLGKAGMNAKVVELENIVAKNHNKFINNKYSSGSLNKVLADYICNS